MISKFIGILETRPSGTAVTVKCRSSPHLLIVPSLTASWSDSTPREGSVSNRLDSDRPASDHPSLTTLTITVRF